VDEPQVAGSDEETRFARDVELLRAGKAIPEGTDTLYQADLAVADLLLRARFVPTPEFSARLQNQLQNQQEIDRRQSMLLVTRSLFRLLFRGALAAGVTAALVLVTAMVVSPEARAQAQGLIARFVEVDSPWALLPGKSNTEESHLALPTPDPDRSPASALSGVLPTPPDLSAPVLPRGDTARPAEPDVLSLEEAQADTSFTIKVPAQPPEGYSFKGVLQRPALAQPEPPAAAGSNNTLPRDGSLPRLPTPVTLLFENAAGEKLMLTEVALPAPRSGEVPLPAGIGSVQEVSVNGQPGQYVAGAWSPQGWDSGAKLYQLQWQGADGVTYTLLSHTLGLDELLVSAESIP
jgi:hypothetical protein